MFLVIVSGCRSYGGKGSESATFEELQRVHGLFEGMLLRRQADLRALEAATSEDERLATLAEQYDELVQRHEALVDEQRETVTELSAESDYRDLHRAFGSMVATQKAVQMGYDGVLEHAYRSFLSSDTTTYSDRPYALIPPYYNQVRESQRTWTLNDVFTATRSGGLLEDGSPLPDIDTTSSAQEAVPGGDEQSVSGGDAG